MREMEEEAEAAAQRDQLTASEMLFEQTELDPLSTCLDSSAVPNESDPVEPKLASNQSEILKALEVVETDSLAIAESFTSLFSSLRLALSEVTGSSVAHMQCFGDTAGRLQESVLDAATKGNRYINLCLRLNDEMKGIDNLATQLKILRRNVDAQDTAVNRLICLP